MTLAQLVGLLITISAVFSYLNFKFLKLPTTIGVMLMALSVSLLALGLDHLGWGDLKQMAAGVLKQVDFNEALMQWMLSFLLFAGALQVNFCELAEQKWAVGILAVLGVVISMLVFGTAIFYGFAMVGHSLEYSSCLLFGALISPTDPIAVLAILKKAGVPQKLETVISCESLFNDGIGVVAFLTMHEIAVSGHSASPLHIASLFLVEAAGGAVLGMILGWITYRLLKSVDNYQVEVLMTLALVIGGYGLATALHTSGPIAIVVAGLVIGNHGRTYAMSETTREHLDNFWELIDDMLNTILFVLIGLEVLTLTLKGWMFVAGMLAIPSLLFARWVSVGVPIAALKICQDFMPGTVTMLTWGGLRGGLSVAMALSLPSGAMRDLVLTVTYVVVVFSIGVQGLTMPRVARRLMQQ
jgi:CPA1 family monovalent cation:H+ antiporter